MKSSIILYPDERLRQKVEYDDALDPNEVICEMYEVALEEDRKHGSILGLSASQIGIPTRIIFFRNDDDGYLKPLTDPVILKSSETLCIEAEGCGSMPGYEVEVERPKYIVVSSREGEGEIFSGWEARIIQHEIDHLDGILILDREVGHERDRDR